MDGVDGLPAALQCAIVAGPRGARPAAREDPHAPLLEDLTRDALRVPRRRARDLRVVPLSTGSALPAGDVPRATARRDLILPTRALSRAIRALAVPGTGAGDREVLPGRARLRARGAGDVPGRCALPSDVVPGRAPRAAALADGVVRRIAVLPQFAQTVSRATVQPSNSYCPAGHSSVQFEHTTSRSKEQPVEMYCPAGHASVQFEHSVSRSLSAKHGAEMYSPSGHLAVQLPQTVLEVDEQGSAIYSPTRQAEHPEHTVLCVRLHAEDAYVPLAHTEQGEQSWLLSWEHCVVM
eukprot:768817-Hanusia_phi.AAC.3